MNTTSQKYSKARAKGAHNFMADYIRETSKKQLSESQQKSIRDFYEENKITDGATGKRITPDDAVKLYEKELNA